MACDLDGSDIFWAIVLGAGMSFLTTVNVITLGSDAAKAHCKARGLEYAQIATSGEIECVKVTREVVK